MFGRTQALGEGLNILTDFVTLTTIFIAALLILIAFFVLALQIFVALPWGVFSGTAWVAERPLGWVATSAVRLFLLAFVASVAVSFVDGLATNLSLEDGGALDVILFACTIFALSWLAPTLASEVMQGAPSLSAAQPAQAAAGAAVTSAGLATSGALIASAFKKAVPAAGGPRAPRSGSAAFGSGGGGSGGAPPRPTHTPNYAAMRPRPRRCA